MDNPTGLNKELWDKWQKENDIFLLTRIDVEALLVQLKHDFISYENPVAVSLVQRMMKFVEGDK